MTPFSDWIALIDRLPDRLRRVTPVTEPTGKGRLRLVLPDSAVLLRELPRPDVAADRRAAWIEARLEPLSPWPPGAFLWAEVPGGPGLRIALSARAPLRAALSHPGVVELQLGPARLVLADPARRARAWARGWAVVMALGLGLALWALWAENAAATAAERDTARLHHLASAAAADRDRARAVSQLATGRTLGPVLDRLAGGLPLDSYLLTLRLTPDEVQIAGLGAAPEAVVPALQAAGFAGIDFAGASSLDASGLYAFSVAGPVGGAP